jgi:hypothetical protein
VVGRKLFLGELAVNEASDVVLNFAEEQERLAELVELKAQVAGGNDAGDLVLRAANQHVVVLDDDADAAKTETSPTGLAQTIAAASATACAGGSNRPSDTTGYLKLTRRPSI